MTLFSATFMMAVGFGLGKGEGERGRRRKRETELVRSLDQNNEFGGRFEVIKLLVIEGTPLCKLG